MKKTKKEESERVSAEAEAGGERVPDARGPRESMDGPSAER